MRRFAGASGRGKRFLDGQLADDGDTLVGFKAVTN
jgi:hypothetical protein